MAHQHATAAAGRGGGSMEIVPYSYSSGRDLELELPPFDVKRQDSLYRDATMPAHAGHHGQVPACWSLDGMANQLATLLTASPQFSILVLGPGINKSNLFCQRTYII